jgi:hypothetical protein
VDVLLLLVVAFAASSFAALAALVACVTSFFSQCLPLKSVQRGILHIPMKWSCDFQYHATQILTIYLGCKTHTTKWQRKTPLGHQIAAKQEFPRGLLAYP